MIRTMFFSILMVGSLYASASGILTLKGKLKSYTESTLTLETAANLYVVNKASLSQDLLEVLKSKRAGHELVMTVSTDALVSVEAKTK
jgi:hypothetical protein